ncbi:hypothetical protein D9M68_567780 [compost metagenome]
MNSRANCRYWTMVRLKRSPGINSGMPGGYGVSSTPVTRPSSLSISTRSTSRCAMRAKASDGFRAGTMSLRYISVVRRATSRSR